METFFQPDEIVTIRGDLDRSEIYYMANGNDYEVVSDEMQRYRGYKGCIQEVCGDGYGYKLHGYGSWVWTDEMFEEFDPSFGSEDFEPSSEDELEAFLRLNTGR